VPESENPLIVVLKAFYGPLVKQARHWPPILAYGLPGIVAVLLLVLLRPVVPNNLIWLMSVVIVAPLVGYIITLYIERRLPRPDTDSYLQNLQRPWGRIDEPRAYQTVGRTIHCSGTATGIPLGACLWLAVESGGFIWPKEGGFTVYKDNQWQATISEDGATKRFSVGLYLVNAEGKQAIEDWFEAAKNNDGEYAEKRAFIGTMRIARVDGLRLRKSASDV